MFFGRALKWKDFEMTERLQWWKEKSLFFPFLFWGYEIHMPPSFTLALAWARLTLFESKTVPLPTFTTMPLRFVLWDTSWKGGGTLDGPMNKGKRGERCRKKVACEWSYAKVIGPRGFKVFLNRCEAEGLPCLHRCKMDSILSSLYLPFRKDLRRRFLSSTNPEESKILLPSSLSKRKVSFRGIMYVLLSAAKNNYLIICWWDTKSRYALFCNTDVGLIKPALGRRGWVFLWLMVLG